MTGKDMHILIVADDTEISAAMIQHAVGQLGADVTLVDSISDACAVAASVDFDVVLASAQVPDGDVTALLEAEDTVAAPVIVIDDGLDGDRVLSAMRLGAADIICRPIDFDYLTRRIRHLVREHHLDQHESRRAERLRRLSSQLIRDRRELRQRVDLICRDLVIAYRRLAEKVVSAPVGVHDHQARFEEDRC